jgi:hypothetical protein
MCTLLTQPIDQRAFSVVTLQPSAHDLKLHIIQTKALWHDVWHSSNITGLLAGGYFHISATFALYNGLCLT